MALAAEVNGHEFLRTAMTMDASRPFYRLGQLRFIGPLPRAEFGNFLRSRFVQSRFEMTEQHRKEKDKKKKIKSPWWNLAEVAMKARGNQIGRITNLISDCIAFEVGTRRS